MPSFNKVMMIGNLTRDPQTKSLPSGMTVAEFGLAMNRRYKTQAGEDREEVCFVDCTAFGKQAETIHQFCKKGKQLFVEGRLKYDQWEKDGQKRSRLTVVVENFQFLGSRDDAGTAGGSGGRRDDGQGWVPDDRGQAAPARQPQRQQAAPQRQQQAAPRQSAGGGGNRPQAAAPATEPPYGDEQQFSEADIPF